MRKKLQIKCCGLRFLVDAPRHWIHVGAAATNIDLFNQSIMRHGIDWRDIWFNRLTDAIEEHEANLP